MGKWDDKNGTTEEHDSVMTPKQEAWIQTGFHEVLGYLNQKGIPFKASDGCIDFEYNGNVYSLQKTDGDWLFELVYLLEWKITDGQKNYIDLLEIANLIHSDYDMVRMIVMVDEAEKTNVVLFRVQNVVYPGADIANLMELSLSLLDAAIEKSKQLIRCRLDEMERFAQILGGKLRLSDEENTDEQRDDKEQLQDLIKNNRHKYQA